MIYQAQAGINAPYFHNPFRRAARAVRLGSYANYPVRGFGDAVTDVAPEASALPALPPVQDIVTTPAGPTFSLPAVTSTEAAAAGAASALWGIVSVVAMGASAYHGYKRNESIGWAIGWGLLGAMFPIITVPVAIAQGFGQKK